MSNVTISEAAAELQISIDTLRRWDKGGIIRSARNSKGHREFSLDEIRRLQGKREARHVGDGQFVVLKSKPTKYTAIDLFAGAGGTALGMENAGIRHVLLAEWDRHACETLRINRPNWNVVEGDVQTLDCTQYRGLVDVVEGGFPCQAFSYAGKSKGFEDTRGTLFFEFARVVSEVMPKVFVGENVRGLLRHDSGRTLETMVKSLQSIKDENGVGYKVAFRVLRAQYLDVAQKRERLIIIGIRDDVESPLLFPKERDYVVSLWEAIANCPPSAGQQYPPRKKEIMDLVPPGGYWRDGPLDIQREFLGGSFHLTGGKTGMARRLAWDEPALTLTCSPAQKQTERCHPVETRPLTTREYARIQSFPDDWNFSGSMANVYKQIGNAVPVNMGYHIGRAVIAMLSGNGQDEFDVAEPLG